VVAVLAAGTRRWSSPLEWWCGSDRGCGKGGTGGAGSAWPWRAGGGSAGEDELEAAVDLRSPGSPSLSFPSSLISLSLSSRRWWRRLVVVLLMPDGGGGGGGGGSCGGGWWWRAAVVAVLVVVFAGGGGVSAAVVAPPAVSRRGVGQQVGSVVALCLFFVLEILLRREPYGALGTSVTRVFTLPLGKEAFAGPAVPSGLCREFPLGTACAESIWACAEWSSLSAQPQIPVVYACGEDISEWPGPSNVSGSLCVFGEIRDAGMGKSAGAHEFANVKEISRTLSLIRVLPA
jgi:hypothetical protein